MKTKQLKNWVIPSIYLLAVLITISCIYFVIISVKSFFSAKKDFDYSINGINDSVPVSYQEEDNNTISVNLDVSIVKPFTDTNVKVGREYYDVNGEESSQEKSIIFFENTYIQNTGVDYISDSKFDVVSVLPGKVIQVLYDENLGNVLKIEHADNVVSIYESVDNIKVKVGEEVTLGEVIATSGKSNINYNFEESLHFEIYDNGKIVNPEKFIEEYLSKENN